MCSNKLYFYSFLAKIMDYIKSNRPIRQLISMPIIWSLLIPLVLIDVWIELYHRICFALYGLEYVKRSDYVRIDRHKLKYLTWYEKLGCVYCGYANGVAAYWTTIAGKTEQYWCGIMHQKYPNFKSPKHHDKFVEYADEDGFKKRYRE
jgi:hypothetical protein